MAFIRGENYAFGRPGAGGRWTHGNKQGFGTAYSADCRLWFTLWNGIVTEVYYPNLDRPQIRDLQYLVGDGEGLFHEEKRDLTSEIEPLNDEALGYKVVSRPPEGHYAIHKEVICAPHMPCLLIKTRVESDDEELLKRLRLYPLCSPHIDGDAQNDDAYVMTAAGKDCLVATGEERRNWLVLSADVPMERLSCGFVGASDGWSDVGQHGHMTWEFDRAEGGNVALTGEIDVGKHREFTLVLSLGGNLQHALTNLHQSCAIPFEDHKATFEKQWKRSIEKDGPDLASAACDSGRLARVSRSVLLAAEDKVFAGATIASPSIPWGEVTGDENIGGYHLVWTRDLVNTCNGLAATGDLHTPLRALIYIASSQHEDGGFAQNFWLDGDPYWTGIQLDEVAMPIALAWRLKNWNALCRFDPYPMVCKAAGYLIRKGPATGMERWEEASGYSPSTLAETIAGLICAAAFMRERGEEAAAAFVEDFADFLNENLEAWTVTTEGTLVEDIPKHYIRILPADPEDPELPESPNEAVLELANQHPDSEPEAAAKDIVDAGFLALVRLGIRAADDPLIQDSLRVVDAVLKRETARGPSWLRYNHDGYGQRDDGSAFQDGWGVGRAWPILTGERGHYEIAAGNDPDSLIKAMEGFAENTGMLPEQVWDADDLPEAHMFSGRPTGAAMPLMWSHAEYLQLLRSKLEGKPFEFLDLLSERYVKGNPPSDVPEIWKENRHPVTVSAEKRLRFIQQQPFVLHWSQDGDEGELKSEDTGLGLHFADLEPRDAGACLQFSFQWGDGSQDEERHEIRFE